MFDPGHLHACQHNKKVIWVWFQHDHSALSYAIRELNNIQNDSFMVFLV